MVLLFQVGNLLLQENDFFHQYLRINGNFDPLKGKQHLLILWFVLHDANQNRNSNDHCFRVDFEVLSLKENIIHFLDGSNVFYLRGQIIMSVVSLSQNFSASRLLCLQLEDQSIIFQLGCEPIVFCRVGDGSIIDVADAIIKNP